MLPHSYSAESAASISCCAAVMASPGFLLLLLVSSSLLLSGMTSPSSSRQEDHHALQKRDICDIKEFKKMVEAVHPIIELIPVVGKYLAAPLKVAAVLGGKADTTEKTIKEQFQLLNKKIDEYHVDNVWNTWGEHYYKHQSKIEEGWDKFETLRKNCESKEKTNKEKKNDIELFKEDYKSIEPEVGSFVRALTTPRGFKHDFKNLLSEQFKCHETDIKQFSVFINTIVYRGVTMNHFYDHLRGQNNAQKLAEKYLAIATFMFKIHKDCISEIDKYVGEVMTHATIDPDNPKKTRKTIITKKTETTNDVDKNELGKKLVESLKQISDKYDWFVVVFKGNPWRVKHLFFAEYTIKGEELKVAVARRLKGSHSKAKDVSDKIKDCIPSSVKCEDVEEEFKKCNDVAHVYVAIHVHYKEESHESSSVPATEGVHRGECNKNHGKSLILKEGKFTVIIKRDEELEHVPFDACKNQNCGEKEKRGKCDEEFAEKTSIPLCECNEGYYGENCEESLEEFVKNMNEDIEKVASKNQRCTILK